MTNEEAIYVIKNTSINLGRRNGKNIYAEALNMAIKALEQPDNSCGGCRYENADDGVLVPCGFCKRIHPDNYERETDERETDERQT